MKINRRRAGLVLAALTAGLFASGAGAVTAGVGGGRAGAHPAPVAYPNFACVALWDTGICVGPPN